MVSHHAEFRQKFGLDEQLSSIFDQSEDLVILKPSLQAVIHNKKTSNLAASKVRNVFDKGIINQRKIIAPFLHIIICSLSLISWRGFHITMVPRRLRCVYAS